MMRMLQINIVNSCRLWRKIRRKKFRSPVMSRSQLLSVNYVKNLQLNDVIVSTLLLVTREQTHQTS